MDQIDNYSGSGPDGSTTLLACLVIMIIGIVIGMLLGVIVF